MIPLLKEDLFVNLALASQHKLHTKHHKHKRSHSFHDASLEHLSSKNKRRLSKYRKKKFESSVVGKIKNSHSTQMSVLQQQLEQKDFEKKQLEAHIQSLQDTLFMYWNRLEDHAKQEAKKHTETKKQKQLDSLNVIEKELKSVQDIFKTLKGSDTLTQKQRDLLSKQIVVLKNKIKEKKKKLK